MTLIVAPLHLAADAIARHGPSHVISLQSPAAESLPRPARAAWLPLTFHDIAEPRPGLTAVTVEQVEALLAFAAGWDAREPLLIQCWAGVSRSPAAAFVIACARSEPGLEADLAARLRAAAPFATPNSRIVSLADALLSREGRMSRAIAEIGRGADTSIGRTFSLPVPPQAHAEPSLRHDSVRPPR